MKPVALIATFILLATPLPAQAPAPAPSLHLSWDANSEPDVSFYRVWRSGDADGPWEVMGVVDHIQSTNEICFRDRRIVAGQEYRYRVSAVDQSGNESGKSKVVGGTIQKENG